MIRLRQRFRIGSCKRLKTLHIGGCENTLKLASVFWLGAAKILCKGIAQGCWLAGPWAQGGGTGSKLNQSQGHGGCPALDCRAS
jgi:hypothetical protein